MLKNFNKGLPSTLPVLLSVSIFLGSSISFDFINPELDSEKVILDPSGLTLKWCLIDSSPLLRFLAQLSTENYSKLKIWNFK